MNQQIAIRELSPQDFLVLGINDIAYVKKAEKAEKTEKTEKTERDIFEIHSADGTVIATMASHDIAFAAVRQNGLEPLSVH